MDVPKEVCTRMRRNPRRVNRPVIKKWCYTPTRESGLDNQQQGEGEGIGDGVESLDNHENDSAGDEDVTTDDDGNDQNEDEKESTPN